MSLLAHLKAGSFLSRSVMCVHGTDRAPFGSVVFKEQNPRSQAAQVGTQVMCTGGLTDVP